MKKLFVSFIMLSCLLPANLALAGEGSRAQSAAASSSSRVSVSETPVATDSVSEVPVDSSFWSRFCVQHPWILRLVKACGVGAGAYALSKVFTSSTLDPLVIGSIVGGAGFVALQVHDDSNLLARLICNPAATVKHVHEVSAQFDEQVKKSGIYDNADWADSLKKYKEILKHWESICPILLLGECTENGWIPCVLSREYQPKYREIYEKRVVSTLCTKIDESHDTPVQYVSFGPGALFQDLVILAKTLVKKSDAILDIHLIDTQFTPYVKLCDLRNGFRAIDLESDYDLGPFMSQLKEIARRDWSQKDSSDHELERLLMFNCILRESRLKQLALWLTKTFPSAHLTFYAHDNAESYVNYISTHKISYPDVLTTADIDDDGSTMQNAHRHYMTLCMQTLLHNSRARNTWLAKVWVNGREDGWYASKDVELVDISLTAGSGTEEIKFKNEDGSDVLIYKKAERI